MTARSARLRRFAPAAFLEINHTDARKLGIGDGDKVKIASASGELGTTARVVDTLPAGLLFLPMSFPDSPVYGLFDSVLDNQAKAPALKSCAVRLERTAVHGQDQVSAQSKPETDR